MDFSLLLLFIPTFWVISLSPGMCMMLALTLGIRHGFLRTMWMMLGELVGVSLVAIAAAIGVASLMINYPRVFMVFCLIGGAYLIWLGTLLWRSQGKMVVADDSGRAAAPRMQLVTQGFITAVSNPKGWAFMVAFLPPFIREDLPMPSQLAALLVIIVVIEFSSMCLYAAGGQRLNLWLTKRGHLNVMNRISGSLLIGVGVWLIKDAF